jgi:plastocyanin
MARRPLRLALGTLVVAALVVAAVIGIPRITGAAAPGYTPQVRDFTVTTVPLVVHEMQGVEPFLKADFAQGGVLYKHEIYGYYPSTLSVYQGDTVRITIVNVEDDPHITVFPGLAAEAIMTKGRSTAHISFVAKKAGVYTFRCIEPEHEPYMYGQIVVLPDRDAR